MLASFHFVGMQFRIHLCWLLLHVANSIEYPSSLAHPLLASYPSLCWKTWSLAAAICYKTKLVVVAMEIQRADRGDEEEKVDDATIRTDNRKFVIVCCCRPDVMELL